MIVASIAAVPEPVMKTTRDVGAALANFFTSASFSNMICENSDVLK